MKIAAEVMDRKFFYASPCDNLGGVLHEMAERGLGSVPVLDTSGRPLGVATMAEFESCYDIEELSEHLRRSAVCMDQHTPLDIAARTLALHPSCCLILVNSSGIAVGAISPVELLRSVLGLNGVRTSAESREGEVDWDAAELLELGAAHRAPEAPGIIMLSSGLDGTAKRIVWAEAALDMRERLDQMLRNPQADPRLESMLEVYPRRVRFRCLTMHDPRQREGLASDLCSVQARADEAAHMTDAERSPNASGVVLKGEPSAAVGA